ncbi:MAG: SGNH/GDSL hydrolase family protein [Oscillospiraceae bacterium]
MNNLMYIDIKKLAHGAITVYKDSEDYVFFQRFSDEQMKFYKDSGGYYEQMSKCQAGIFLSFYTDGNYLEFEYSCTDTEDAKSSIDLYVDDSFSSTYDITNTKKAKIKIQLLSLNEQSNNEKNMKKVTLYLPPLACIGIKNFCIDAKYVEKIEENPTKMLFLGDSITQGMYVTHASFTYQSVLTRLLGVSGINQGIGGFMITPEILNGWENASPDVILVAYGTNDWYFRDDLSRFKEDVYMFFNRLSEVHSKAKIYVVTPIWRGDFEKIGKMCSLKEVSLIIKENALKHKNMVVIDGIKCFPHNAEFMEDGYLHPNDMGFLLYACELLKQIRV